MWEADRFKMPPSHNGLLLVTIGGAGVWMTVTPMEDGVVLVHPFTVTETVYVPALITAAFEITAFCCVDVNPFGPVQL